MQTKTVPLLCDFSPDTPVLLTAETLPVGSQNRHFPVQDGLIHPAHPNGLTANSRKFQRLDDRMGRGYDVAGETQKSARHSCRKNPPTGGCSNCRDGKFYRVTFRKT